MGKKAILQAADDPDRDFLLQAEIGLPVRILEPLPRTPYVFEPQEKWPLENTLWEPALAWVPNYGSTRDHLDFAKAKFDEEIEEGLMEKMSPDTFKKRFGDNTAIAALAVIVEDEEKDKKRLIHDATHGVRVNHRIKCRDKLRAPLATLIAMKLWIPDSEDRQTSRVALRGFTDNQSNEALVKKAMTTKYPSSLVLLELAEELAAKKCDLSLTRIRRDLNQLADDLTNEKFDMFDPEFRVALKGEDMRWRVLDKLLSCADNFYSKLKKRKAAPIGPARKAGKVRKLDPW